MLHALNAHFKLKMGIIDGGGDESSDDGTNNNSNISDTSDQVVTEEYIKNGKPGVIVFHNVKCMKTGLFKTFHLHLYDVTLTQFTGLISKKYPCTDIVDVSKSSKIDEPDIVVIKVKHNMKMASLKKFAFDLEINYSKFKHYIIQLKDIGGYAKQAFDRIDVRNSGCIYPSNLRDALYGLGLKATDDDIANMLSISDDDSSQVCHYEEFYHLFAKLEVTSVRECLHSWLYQAKAAQHTDEQVEFRRNHVIQGVKRLPGEEILLTIDKCRWSIYYGFKPKKNELFSGRVYITSYRVYLATYFPNFGYCHSSIDIPMYFDRISLPLSSIYRVQSVDTNELIITGKDNRIIRIEIILSQQLVEPPKADQISQQLSKVAFKQKKETLRSYAFAYKYFERVDEFAFNGWTFSEIRREYARQGLTNSVLYKVSYSIYVYAMVYVVVVCY